MATHFNAFISYRHCQPDAAIAGRIQQQLERFHIPGPIRKATGIKKIDRIFRDKEELPLSSDLGLDIEEALRNSDFLIVICSPRLKASEWCRREIEIFLQTHSIDRVLTVLAEGEPQDVVPEILVQGREPLSCDYRMPPRKARQIELPRLAAAILGCRYDDLRQRQRQYRARQRTALLSAFLTASIALSVYFYRTSQQIQANYLQSLRNQSKFLSAESQELLEEGDRLSAISLALEALPANAEDERPWLAEAEYALSEAVNAYGSSSEVLAVNAFTHKGVVDDYFISDDGLYLVSWDEYSHVYVWDTQSFSLLRTFDPALELEFNPVLSAPGNLLLIGSTEGIQCYNYLTGELVWESAELDGSNLLLSPDGSRFVPAAYACDGVFSLVETATGRVLSQFSLPEELTSGYDPVHPMAFSDDGKYIALRYGSSYLDDCQVLICDTAANRCAVWNCGMERIDAMIFTADGRLLLSGETVDTDYSAAMLNYGYTNLVQDAGEVHCLTPDTAELCWSSSFDYFQVNFSEALTLAQYPMEDGTTREVLCCTYANICVILDTATGELLQRLELPASSVQCEYENGMLYWYLTSGEYCTHKLGQNYVISFSYFPASLINGHTIHGLYIQTHNSTRILLYQAVTDSSWTGFAGDSPLSYMNQAVAATAEYLVVQGSSYTGQYNCYDLQSQQFLRSFTLENPNQQTVLGFAADGQTLLIADSANSLLSSLNIVTGDTAELALPLEPTGDYNAAALYGSCAPFLWNGRVGYLVQSYNAQTESGSDGSYSVTLSEDAGLSLCLLDPQTQAMEQFELMTVSMYETRKFAVAPDTNGNYLFVTETTYDSNYNPVTAAWLFDEESGSRSDLTDLPVLGYGETLNPVWNADSTLLAHRSATGTRISRPNGVVLCDIPANGLTPLSACFTPEGDSLLILYSDASLCRYDSSGNLLNRSEIYCYVSGLSVYSSVSWSFSGSTLLVTADHICTLIDMESWGAYTYVRQCLHYDAALDRFYVSTTGDGSYILASYNRYTTQDLIDKAHEILGENTLTDEQRSQYGLD